MGSRGKSKKKSKIADLIIRNSLLFITAAKAGDSSTIQTLLTRSRIDVHFKTNEAIKQAIFHSRTEVALMLLADPRFKIQDLYQELFLNAVRVGNVEIVQFFLRQTHIMLDPAANGNMAIQEASVHGHVEIIRLLLACPGVDPAAENNSPLQRAVYFNHTEAARLLLSADSRVDPTCHGDYLLQMVAREGYVDMVQLLLADPRINPSSCFNAPIQRAAQRNQIEVARLLLADARVNLTTAVTIAATDEMRDLLVQELLARNFCINFNKIDFISKFGLSKLVTAKIYEFVDFPLSTSHHKKYMATVYQYLHL